MDERPTPRRSASSRSGGRRSPVRRAPDETRGWIWAITASGTDGGFRMRARPILVMSTGDQTTGAYKPDRAGVKAAYRAIYNGTERESSRHWRCYFPETCGESHRECARQD